MNKTEKKAFEMLSDEEKEQVSGGATLDEKTELSNAQCQALSEKLEKKIGKISLKPQIDPQIITKVAYGGAKPFEPVIAIPEDFPPCN